MSNDILIRQETRLCEVKGEYGYFHTSELSNSKLGFRESNHMTLSFWMRQVSFYIS